MNKILVLLSHSPNPRFIKQLNLLSQGNKVSLAYLNRSQSVPPLLSSLSKNIEQVELGKVKNFKENPNLRDYSKRVWDYLRIIFKIKKLSKTPFDVVLTNNIDTLLLFIFSTLFQGPRKNIYAVEISDLKQYIFHKTIFARTIKLVERIVFRYFVDKLIVTSRKYFDFHYSKFYDGELFILENKVIPAEYNSSYYELGRAEKRNKIVVGIVGLLLRGDEYVALFDTFGGCNDIEIHIYGTGPCVPLVNEYIDIYENIMYYGPYNAFQDAEEIYRSLDVLYVVYDTELTSKNNILALPNKLYEAMFFKVPIICSQGTYLEEIVMNHRIGVGVDFRRKGDIARGVKYCIRSRDELSDNLNSIPSNVYDGNEDYIRFVKFLSRK